MEARIVNVILVEDNDERTYFTLEGIQLCQLVGGVHIRPAIQPSLPTTAKLGGVVKAPTAAEYKNKQRKEKDKELTLENRIEYEKRNNT